MNGTVFDIKEFTVHDGPGSRITVFLKGCLLRCKWCHNPEGLSNLPQLMYKSNLCSHCGKCYLPCKHNECKPFGRCVHICPNDCLAISGKEYSDDELAKHLLKSRSILEMMGGGVTFSGGEPLLQDKFICNVADKIGTMSKAIQTSGFAEFEIYKSVIEKMDYVMQDIKIIDEQKHIFYTGVSNEKIIKNAEWLKTSGKPFVFRVPLIPNITDTEENLREISEFVGNFKTELMPYNSLASAKYDMVNMKYMLDEEKNRDEDFTKYFNNAITLK